MPSRYIDTTAIIQVIGNIFKNPDLLDPDGKYFFNEEDFKEEFHKILFGSMYNLYMSGVKDISIETIEDYLEQRPSKMAIYKVQKGAEYLAKLAESTQSLAFEYYYQRMKKMTLLRMYNENCGMDLSWLYDIDNVTDIRKKQAQEDWLDNSSLDEIADTVDRKISAIRAEYVENSVELAEQAGSGIDELLDMLAECPEVGIPLYGPLINTITRGARLKKVYLRSAPSGVGKTRAMIADACTMACGEVYDLKEKQWAPYGSVEPVLYITTEQELSDIQTMMLAFLSGVDEEHILKSQYLAGEPERVTYAAKLLKKAPLYIKELPDFSMQDIENTIKNEIREHKIRYVFHDYIHSSMKILSEISSKAGIKGLREDNILFMISVKLKDIANKFGVFILTSTQLNGSYVDADVYDQNLLRGAKAIADKVDCGMIMLETTAKDVEALRSLCEQNGLDIPAIKLAIYKNRRGRYKSVLLWCREQRGICRIEPMFMTNYAYELQEIQDIKIKVQPREEEGAF